MIYMWNYRFTTCQLFYFFNISKTFMPWWMLSYATLCQSFRRLFGVWIAKLLYLSWPASFLFYIPISRLEAKSLFLLQILPTSSLVISAGVNISTIPTLRRKHLSIQPSSIPHAVRPHFTVYCEYQNNSFQVAIWYFPGNICTVREIRVKNTPENTGSTPSLGREWLEALD